MPGPCATKPYKKNDSKPNRKSSARLARRIAGFKEPGSSERSNGLWSHKPGSQNRNK